MQKFIPYRKLSKKKQRAINASRRVVWPVNPVTRTTRNPKAYDRKAARKREDDPGSVPFPRPEADPPGNGEGSAADRTA